MKCKNCNSELIPSMRYCGHCGNKVVTQRLTVNRVISEFSNQFFNYDNKIFKTFLHLITRPEAVINMFVNGARKTYMNVISYLGISVTLIGFHIFILKKFLPESAESKSMSPLLSPEIQEQIVKVSEIVMDYSGLIAVAFIPITSIATYLIFKEKKFNYAEHIVLNMYAVAQYSILMFLLTSILLLLGIANTLALSSVGLISFLYLGYCYYRFFKLKIFEAVWMTLASQILYSIFSFIIVVFIFVLFQLAMKIIN